MLLKMDRESGHKLQEDLVKTLSEMGMSGLRLDPLQTYHMETAKKGVRI